MSRPTSPIKSRLAAIARNAMHDRGLLPDFSPVVVAELHSIAQAATTQEPSAGLRDLRALPWASIDNDGSRDLDQLSAA